MAQWAIAPKGQSDPQAGSEASGGHGNGRRDDRTTGGPMLKMLISLMGVAIATKIALDFLRAIKENDHDGQDRDR